MTFNTQTDAEKFLADLGFNWDDRTASFDNPDGRTASIVDYGFKCVVSIW